MSRYISLQSCKCLHSFSDNTLWFPFAQYNFCSICQKNVLFFVVCNKYHTPGSDSIWLISIFVCIKYVIGIFISKLYFFFLYKYLFWYLRQSWLYGIIDEQNVCFNFMFFSSVFKEFPWVQQSYHNSKTWRKLYGSINQSINLLINWLRNFQFISPTSNN